MLVGKQKIEKIFNHSQKEWFFYKYKNNLELF